MTLSTQALRSTLVSTMLATLTLTITPALAGAQGNPVGGSGTMYYLNDEFTGKANIELNYGEPNDVIYFGDWDGNGTDTPMVRRGNQFHVRNTNTSGRADNTFHYGDPGDTVLVGDWNGDGKDTLAVRRGNVFHIKNTTTTGVADKVIAYGDPGDTVLVGDWNGDGIDAFGVRRGNRYYLRYSLTSGKSDVIYTYGDPADTVLAGDWDGSGADHLAIRRGNTYYFKNFGASGIHDFRIIYGNPDDAAFVGDWDGDGKDTLGVRRPITPTYPPYADGRYLVGATIPPGTYRATDPDAASCAWERLRGFGGTFEDVIAWNLRTPLAIVTIEPSDTGFRSVACGTWVPVERTYPSAPLSDKIPGSGSYVVNKHIAPGTYHSDGELDCSWARVSSFSGLWDDNIQVGPGGTSLLVSISPLDTGFVTSRCGEWTRVG